MSTKPTAPEAANKNTLAPLADSPKPVLFHSPPPLNAKNRPQNPSRPPICRRSTQCVAWRLAPNSRNSNNSLACKEFYPDIEVVGRYDAFWQEDPLRPMVGMNLN